MRRLIVPLAVLAVLVAVPSTSVAAGGHSHRAKHGHKHARKHGHRRHRACRARARHHRGRDHHGRHRGRGHRAHDARHHARRRARCRRHRKNIRYHVGLSEQHYEMFQNPLYQALDVDIARLVVPWDVMSRPEYRQGLIYWLAGAKATGARPLVSFYISQQEPYHLPTEAEYVAAWDAFHAMFPDVKDISPWNEANHASPDFANPSPRRAAAYYELIRERCDGCHIVALDALDGTKPSESVRYVRRFRRLTREHPPRIWGLHNYSDTNRFSDTRTKMLVRAMKGGQIWLTETGGVVRLGRSFDYDPERAAKALRFMFKLAGRTRRIRRLYIYQWTGATPQETFDAGLLDADGNPRPGYDVVKRHLAHLAHLKDRARARKAARHRRARRHHRRQARRHHRRARHRAHAKRHR